jgi:hypothetical protein
MGVPREIARDRYVGWEELRYIPILKKSVHLPALQGNEIRQKLFHSFRISTTVTVTITAAFITH